MSLPPAGADRVPLGARMLLGVGLLAAAVVLGMAETRNLANHCRGDLVPLDPALLAPALVAVVGLILNAVAVGRGLPRATAAVAASLVAAVATASVAGGAAGVAVAVGVAIVVAELLARRSGEGRRPALLAAALVLLLLLEVWSRADQAGSGAHGLGYVGLLLATVVVASVLLAVAPGSRMALGAGWLAAMVLGSLVAELVQNKNAIAGLGVCPDDTVIGVGLSSTPTLLFVVVAVLCIAVLAPGVRAERRRVGPGWLALAMLALLPAGLLHAALDHGAAVLATWALVVAGAGLLLLDRGRARRRTDPARVPEPASSAGS